MNTTDTAVIRLDRATLVGELKLRLEFADGKITTVDFGPFLRASRHPDLRRYLKKENFSRFVVEDGQLYWNDFDLIFPLIELYDGKIAVKGTETQTPAPAAVGCSGTFAPSMAAGEKVFPFKTRGSRTLAR
jgi:hypothetical protein